jgi:hypothetical protein
MKRQWIKTKPSLRNKLILENDRLFREIIRARDKVCQMSLRKENLQVCHYWTRSILRTRWDMTNAVLLNSGKHIFFAHKYPDKFKEWFIRRIGQREFDLLEIRARYVAPVKMEDLMMINDYLKIKIEEIKCAQSTK